MKLMKNDRSLCVFSVGATVPLRHISGRSFLLRPMTGIGAPHSPEVTGLVKALNWGHVPSRNFA